MIRLWEYQNGRGIMTVVHAITRYARLKTLRSFYDIGSFEVDVSPEYLPHVHKWMLIEADDFWGIIKRIYFKEGSENLLTISGPCIKGMLAQRITWVSSDDEGLLGYDEVAGTTEACVRHYIENNATSPKDPDRTLRLFRLERNQFRGAEDDKYYSRHEKLSDVVTKLLKRQEIGWELLRDAEGFTFALKERRDRTAGQVANIPVKLSFEGGRLNGIEYEDSDMDMKNAFYCQKSSSDSVDQALVQLYYTDDQPVEDLERVEHVLSVSVDSDNLSEMKTISQKEMASFEGVTTIKGTLDSRVDVTLGDIVTIVVPPFGIVIERTLTELEEVTTSAGKTRSATFGDSALTKFEKIEAELRRKRT